MSARGEVRGVRVRREMSHSALLMNSASCDRDTARGGGAAGRGRWKLDTHSTYGLTVGLWHLQTNDLFGCTRIRTVDPNYCIRR